MNVLDAWVSSLTGAGTSNDRTQSFAIASDLVSPTTCKQIYVGSPLVRLCVDLPTEEACRAGYDVVLETPNQTQKLQDQMCALRVEDKLQQALQMCRMVGGSALLFSTQDADLSLPLKPGTKILGIHVFGAGEVVATGEYISSLDSKYFGLPAYYRISSMLPGATISFPRIHHSRLAVMSGPTTDMLDRLRRQGFGASTVEMVFAACRAYEIGADSSSALLTDFAAGILTLPGLSDAMASVTETDQSGVDMLSARLRMLDKYRSVHKSVVLDGGNGQRPPETFTRVVTPLAGLPDLIDRHLQRVSMISRIPVSILVGTGATGLLNNGSESTQAFRAFCQTIQTTYHQPTLERVVQVLLGLDVNISQDITYRPLAVPTAQEQSATELAQANTDNVYLLGGVLSPNEVRQSRFVTHTPISVEGDLTGDIGA